MNKYRWLRNDTIDEAAAGALVAELAIPAAAARFLVGRSIDDPAAAREYFQPTLAHTHDPFLFERMREAVALVRAAEQEAQVVLVHGDYDVDGISGAALLFHYLSGAFATVLRFVPDRRRDGYGVAERAIEWAIEQKVGLFIAVDCGTSDAPRLRRLEAAGIRVSCATIISSRWTATWPACS